ncbi:MULTISPECIES: NAD-dependent protein deacylase [unclassified Luteococcus]|uniref:NAD-dependent protein deacylase n=1 Tax=unclassified Luteococcus TaxID=2639923 RepID=UPI00313D6A6D
MDSLASILTDARDIVFFGGAGISTESGIPDFRSSAGLYARATPDAPPPEYLLSHDCLVHDPQAFFDFHRTSLLHPDAEPNRAHRALARLEQAGKLGAVITQNIDGLHQAAGSRRVLELHGSAQRNSCVGCGAQQDMAWMLGTTGVPSCPACGEMVRPDVVLYGEALDGRVMDQAIEAILGCDVLLVGGTSLNVYPAAGLVRFHRGPHLVLVNRDATPYDAEASLVIHDSLGQVLGDAVDLALGTAD